jgi:hypothetical protein
MNYQRDSNCLSPAERKRLAKLLGLLGSDHAGEVLSAAKHAHDLVQARGLPGIKSSANHPRQTTTPEKPVN